jgi:deazaflavin-dependent oxidoreductase (nitroreductase family)
VSAVFGKLGAERAMSDQSGQRERVDIPADMKEFNRSFISEFRAKDGQLSGRWAGRQILLLTTRGARSGEERTVVLGYGRSADGYVVIASNNGAPAHPAWYHNLLADPRATVEVGSEKVSVRARTARPEERGDLATTVPYVAQQQGLTSRQIPLVVLEPERP